MSKPNSSSFNIVMNGSLTNAGPLDAVLSSTVLFVYFDGRELGNFTLPEIEVSGGKDKLLNIESVFAISSVDTLQQFFKVAMQSRKLEWTIKANLSLTVRAVNMGIDGLYFYKNVSVFGMDGFKNVNVSGVDLPSDSTHGIRMTASTSMNNPSSMEMEMGNALFALHYDGTEIARAKANDLLVRIGQNQVQMSGDLLKVSNTNLLSKFFSDYISGKDSLIRVRGLSSGKGIKWLDSAIQQFDVQTMVSGIKDFKVIDKFEIDSMEIEPIDQTTMKVKTRVKILYSMPFNFPVSVISMKQNCHLFVSPNISAVKLVASSINCNDHERQLEIELQGQMLITSDSEYQRFLKLSIYSSKVELEIQGQATAQIQTNIGTFNVDIPITNVKVAVSGLRNFEHPSVVLKSFNLQESDNGRIRMEAVGGMFNPSPMILSLGNCKFNLFYEHVLVARLHADRMVLERDMNYVKMVGYLTRLKSEREMRIVSKFFGNYLKGIDSMITIQGVKTENGMEWIDYLLQLVSLNVNVPGLKNFNMVKGIEVGYMDLKTRKEPEALVAAKVAVDYQLPFDFPITIHQLSQDTHVSSKKGRFGFMSVHSTKVLNKKKRFTAWIHGRLSRTSHHLFDEFLIAQMQEMMVRLRFKGHAGVVFSCAVGTFEIDELPIDSFTFMMGMNSFQTIMPVIEPPQMLKGSRTGLHMKMSVSIYNPSVVSVFGLGDCEFDLEFNNKVIGTIFISNFGVTQGLNNLTVIAVLKQVATLNQRLFFSKYMNGDKLSVSLVNGSTNVLLFAKAFQAIRIKTSLPGLDRLKHPVILTAFIGPRKGFMNELLEVFSLALSRPSVLSTGLQIENPFAIQFRLTGINTTIYDESHDQAIGQIDSPDFEPMTISSLQTRTEKDLTVITIFHPTIEMMAALVMKRIFITVKGSVSVLMDEFHVQVDIVQQHIPCRLSLENLGDDGQKFLDSIKKML